MSQHGINGWRYNLDTKTISSSFGVFSKFGLNSNEISNVPYSVIERKIIHPEDAEKYAEIFTRLHNGESPVSSEIRLFYAELSEYHWTRIVYSLIESPDGRYSTAIGSTIDITEEYELHIRQENMLKLYQSNINKDTLLAGFSNLNENQLIEVNAYTNFNLKDEIPRYDYHFFNFLLSKFIDKDDYASTFKQLNRNALLHAYQQGETVFNRSFKLKLTPEDSIRYVTLKMELTADSSSKDILIFFSLTDESKQHLMEQMLEKNVKNGLDSLLAINMRTDRLILSLEKGKQAYDNVPDIPYSEFAFQMGKTHLAENEDLNNYLQHFSYENIRNELDKNDNIMFTCQNLQDGEIRTQRVRIFYIDKEMDIIGISNNDITDSVKERQELLMLLLNVVELACVIDIDSGSYVKHTMETMSKALAPESGHNFDEHCIEEAKATGEFENCHDILNQLRLNVMIEELHKNPSGYTLTHDIFIASSACIKMDNIFWVDEDHRYIGILRTDITNAEKKSRRQREDLSTALELAKRANAAKSDFLASMSHDIRTPMNAIMGMTELALMEPIENKAVRENLLIIKNSSLQLLNLINDILEMSRIESGKLTLVKQPFNNTEEYNIAMERYTAFAKAEGIHFSHSISTIHNHFVGDAIKIHRIVDNLLSNAFKFTPAGGTVTYDLIEIPTSNHNIAFFKMTISDTEIGMNDETIANLFEPFYMANKEQSKNSSGLGLPIVKRIVEYCDGTIDVSSELERGTTFTITIPLLIDNNNYDKAEKTEEKLDTSCLIGKNILVCEDHPINQKVIKKILDKLDVNVTIASNGQLGVEQFLTSKKDDFDIILMDIQMPVMNGLEATRAIRLCKHPQGKTIPIIAMTANAFVEDKRACLDAGMNDHLAKPIIPNKLYGTLIKYVK